MPYTTHKHDKTYRDAIRAISLLNEASENALEDLITGYSRCNNDIKIRNKHDSHDSRPGQKIV